MEYRKAFNVVRYTGGRKQIMIDDRTRKVLQAIIKHCNTIADTKSFLEMNIQSLRTILFIKMQY